MAWFPYSHYYNIHIPSWNRNRKIWRWGMITIYGKEALLLEKWKA
ncbi:MAG: hypothetical protein UHM08_08950 [Bacteroidales bacterium]|nr:hypothetical protein [Bacteroidales bacterium]